MTTLTEQVVVGPATVRCGVCNAVLLQVADGTFVEVEVLRCVCGAQMDGAA